MVISVLVSTLIPLIRFYKISNLTFSDTMNRNVSDTTSLSVSHMLDGQQSSVTKDLAINVNQFVHLKYNVYDSF